MRVLVVDDSAFVRRALSLMIETDPELRVVGHASDGREALELIPLLRPDVVTLDLQMPEMSGLEVLERIRTVLPEPRPGVIVCSSVATSESEESVAALRAGACAVIPKDWGSLALRPEALRDELVRKIRAAGAARTHAGSGGPGR